MGRGKGRFRKAAVDFYICATTPSSLPFHSRYMRIWEKGWKSLCAMALRERKSCRRLNAISYLLRLVRYAMKEKGSGEKEKERRRKQRSPCTHTPLEKVLFAELFLQQRNRLIIDSSHTSPQPPNPELLPVPPPPLPRLPTLPPPKSQ